MSFFIKPPSALSKAITLLAASSMVGQVFAASGTTIPVPNTYIDLPVPTITGWNLEANTRTLDVGVDGYTGATGKTFIYPNATVRDADVLNNPPTSLHYGIGSTAYVNWELDDFSGKAPGIKAVTDDFAFKYYNCIMASGERAAPLTGTIVPKTCSDDEGSGKRYKLKVTQTALPVDIVLDLGKKDVRYKGVKVDDPDSNSQGGVQLSDFRDEFGIGRIYRVIQKITNDSGKRWAGVKFEIGTGVGDAFTPLTRAQGVAFEMRTVVPREFWDGDTGAPDREVWVPDAFANFSPKVFVDPNARTRFKAGFFDNQASGFMPSLFEAGDHSQYISSGVALNADGYFGGIKRNYFDMKSYLPDAATQLANVNGTPLGYMLPNSLLPSVIVVHDDGNAETENDGIKAWWDGANYRYGRGGSELAAPDATTGLINYKVPTPADSFGIVPDSVLGQWAAKLVGFSLPAPVATTDPAYPAYLESVKRYQTDIADDLSGLNTDTFIYVGEELLNPDGSLKIGSITMRFKPTPASEVAGADNANPAWIDATTGKSNAPDLSAYLTAAGPVALDDNAYTVESKPVTVNVLANDLLVIPEDATDPLNVIPRKVVKLDDPTAVITLVPDAEIQGDFVLNADKTVTYTPRPTFVGAESIKYTVTLNAGTPEEVISNEATLKVSVAVKLIADAPIAENDSAVVFSGQSVTLDVLANDNLKLTSLSDGVVVVEIVDAPLNGTAVVQADNTILYTAKAIGIQSIDRFTYRIVVDGTPSNAALITIRIDPPTSWSKSGSGCSVGNPNAPFDPILPSLLALALAGMFLRRRRHA